jgi:hypothetical protein
MTKLCIILILISVSFQLEAQDGYVKYNSDSSYRNDTIKISKGEIFPYFNSTIPHKINVLFGIDTIRDLNFKSKTYEIVQAPNTTYLSQKGSLAQLKKDGMVYVNATTIDKKDTVTLISESGKQLTQLISTREAQVNQSDCGKTFRLIITGAPTIFYATDKLTQYIEPEQPQGTTDQNEENKKSWSFWYYIIIGLSMFLIGFSIWWFFFKGLRKQKGEPIYVQYNANKSLSDFARDYKTDLGEFLSMNKKTIDKKYISYENRDRKQVQEDLKGQKLIVGYQTKSSSNAYNSFSDNLYNEKREQPIIKENGTKDVFVQPTNFGNNNDVLSNQLRDMQNTLIREIQKVSSGNIEANEINRLRNEKSELENKIKGLETDKGKLDSTLAQLQANNSSLENSLQAENAEKSQFQSELKELKEKVITVEFLKNYSESVFAYLKYCQQVSNDAYNFFNRISQQNPLQAFATGHLLMKFQSSVNTIPVGNWIQIVQDIKDTGATTSRQLIRSFSQIQNNNDKLREFQRLLFSEVLTRYSSNILILAEAFKNISRFQGSTDFTSDTQNTFDKYASEIVSKAKSIGLELKHVSLFENWEKYIGQIEDKGGERSLAYKDVGSLEKGAIAEIVSVGVKTSFEDTKTIIILA